MNPIPYTESRIFMSFYVWWNACRKHIQLFLEDVNVQYSTVQVHSVLISGPAYNNNKL